MDSLFGSLGSMTGLSAEAYQRRIETAHSMKLARDGYKIQEVIWSDENPVYGLVYFTKGSGEDIKKAIHTLHSHDLEKVRKAEQEYQESSSEHQA
ncbi:hypothetical protein [Sicyoidochytrium minutum DNA virus]|nr:hypothetical protein [Sicyoidochytrium minutum DNA virus]BDC17073.1 hypothetical protein [Sicyoidochytrium minutum DNA virus]